MSAPIHPLLRALRDTPAALALVDPHRSLTYAALDAASARVASALAHRGLHPGDRVALVLRGSLDAAVCLVACLRRGLVIVPVNPGFQAAELAHTLTDSGASLVLEDEPCPPLHVLAVGIPIVATRALCDDAIAPHDTDTDSDVAVTDDDLAMLIYTSGTTGRAKGCAHTVGSLRAGIEALMAHWGISPDDVVLNSLPWFHVHGLCVCLLGALSRGACTRVIPRFSPEAVVAGVRDGGTVWMSVPTMIHRVLGALGEDDARALGALRLVTCGSAALSAEQLAAFRDRTGLTILERYGMSETLITLSNPLHGTRVPGAVGWPVGETRVRVVDDELLIASPSTMRGYWNRPDADADVFVHDPDGTRWFRTGDIVSRDPDGCVRIVGRASQDILKVGGHKLSTREIEEHIATHPAVREVAVVGLADAEWGERVCAVVVLHPGASLTLEALQAHVQLAEVKRPRVLRVVEALPRNALGKVMKAALKAAEP